MKDIFIKELEPGSTLSFFAVVVSKEMRQSRSGKPYLCVRLRDRTGEIDGRAWDSADALAEGYDAGDVIKVQAAISTYQDTLQASITRVRKAEEEEIELSDYLPATEKDVEQMYAEVRVRIGQFRNSGLATLCEVAWSACEDSIKKAPAAERIHHAFVGGLLEHIHGLMLAADRICQVYPELDPDLMAAACIWHDIGKVQEITVGLSFGYSVRGSLCGHVAIALDLLHHIDAMHGIDNDTVMLLEHIIVSHHGKLEYGAMRVPAIPEAIAFHYLDELDAKLAAARTALAGEVDANGMTPWTKGPDARLWKRPRTS